MTSEITIPKDSVPIEGVVERFKPYGNESVENIHQANFALALVDKGLDPKDIELLMKAQTDSVVRLSKAKSETRSIALNDSNKTFAFMVSSIAIFIPIIPGIDTVVTYSIASIGAVGFATSLHSFFGAKAFEAGKKFRDLFRSPSMSGKK